MEAISSRISGWRVTDSMTLPNSMPMPAPAPAAPPPAPTPRAIARPAFWPMTSFAAAPCCAMKLMVSRSSGMGVVGLLVLVVFGDGTTQVDARQDGEDERLQGGDQRHLEQEDGDAGGQGEPGEDLEAEQHGETAGHELDEHVA